MITQILGGLAGIGLGAACIALLVWLRRVTPKALQPVPGRARPSFYDVPAGTRWLTCYTLTCARMTMPHVPIEDGVGWRCTNCGHTTTGAM
ncbi:hypothetical protein AB0O20_28630 [Streptomyces kronopolitis]|uniref:hypothetical protein n=1 Tax=Streptomyces kronopolitis TaxID=1612435 RepID=UPI00343D00FB